MLVWFWLLNANQGCLAEGNYHLEAELPWGHIHKPMLLRKVRKASKSDQSSLPRKAQEFDFPSDFVWCSILRLQLSDPSQCISHCLFHSYTQNLRHVRQSPCSASHHLIWLVNGFRFLRNEFCGVFIFHYRAIAISRHSSYRCQNFQTHYDGISKPDISE